MFVDKVRISISAGNGGNGAVSFHREKYVAAGGPDGGDGGRGGDVILIADEHLSTLLDFKFKRKYKAEDGVSGGTKKCTGRSGEHLTIKVPIGTVVRDVATGLVMADLSDEKPVVMAKGGRGGWGNTHFASATRQIPNFAKPGLPGQSLELELELKLLADVGLVGFPNVGKSTLISVVSGAKPKIANYHFTTLSPVLGVVRIGPEQSFVMADIPGLIEGASEGVGLGHEFLRHVDRCRLIVHVVDVSGCEGRDPREDFEKINYELRNFSPELADRPQIVAANKSDIASPEALAEFRGYIEEKGYKFFEISAVTHSGTKELVNEVAEQLTTLPPIKRYETQQTTASIPKTARMKWSEFEIKLDDDGVYVVSADWLSQTLGMVDPDDYESLQYMQRVLKESGVFNRLEKMGINEGDTVDILGFEFDYVR